jgi:hypothetical protein
MHKRAQSASVLADEIVSLIKVTQKRMGSHLPALHAEVDAIITNKERSVSRIENMLDTLLGCTEIGVGTDEFIRLNNYYRTFNRRNARVYDRFYRESQK